ncbi:MAG: DUF2804 domain-containing protein [Deltaproteobacteria bacterium]|nr:DUF2804 domain-containing protein [Deltaproteobacteria bacterium]
MSAPASSEREITTAVDIARPDGRLSRDAIGWARHPILRCNLRPGVPRFAQWDYWCFGSRSSALTVLVADVGYLGIVLVSFLDFAARRPVERLYVRPGGLPIAMPATPRGDIVVDAARLHLALRNRDDELHVECAARTLLGKRIAVELVVQRPPAHETINVLVPWDDTRFQLTSKQQALPARGVVRIDAREHTFGPEHDSFACLDYGRGRWPSRIEWSWAFASSARGGRTLGMNLGGTWTDGTGVTENGFVIDGRVHKIADAVDFAFDRRAFMKPWRIRTRTTSRLDLDFHPIRERAVRIPLGIAGVELHQMMGSFHGTFVDDAGATLVIEDVVGLAEWVRGRW